MNQQIHSNEQIGLLEMPVEILPDILIHLHAKDLLTVSHVCTLLASNAETAFARKYANETYLVDFSIKSERRLLQVILNKYGEKLQKLHINSSFEHDAKDREKLLDLVQQKCCNLKSLKLVGARKMIMLKNLTEFNLFGQLNLNRETFAEFVFNNPQLETLDLCTIDIDWLDLLDGRLNMLKKLVCGGISFVTKLSKIRLNSLETLELKLNSFARLLQTMNCNQIKELILRKFCDPGDVDEDLINEICSFEALASLHLNSVPITENQLVTLAQKLPHLIDLRMKLFEFESIFTVSTHVRSVLSTIQKLKKLTIDLDGNNLLQNIFEKYSSHDLYSNFTNTSTEINIICERVLLSITNDYLFECDLATAELHWMNNLNDKNVQEAMARLRKWSIFLYNLKFINNCAESTLDISSLKSLAMRLDIKSKGPITVNAMTNVSVLINEQMHSSPADTNSN